MRLYVRHMPATPKYMKRAKVRGYASDELLLNCAFFDICDSIVRDLRLPGRLESCAWTNEALVGPIADGFPHGKCFRSNPFFTFDSILCRGKQRALGQEGNSFFGQDFCDLHPSHLWGRFREPMYVLARVQITFTAR